MSLKANNTQKYKIGDLVLVSLFVYSYVVWEAAYVPLALSKSVFDFNVIRVGSMVSREIKRNLHNGEVRGDVLRPPR